MGLFNWIKKILTYDPAEYKPPVGKNKDAESGMNEGDFRSGPNGYSPNTSYPDSFYGSGQSSDDGQNEGDQAR